jgi:hypothetical protein
MFYQQNKHESVDGKPKEKIQEKRRTESKREA